MFLINLTYFYPNFFCFGEFEHSINRTVFMSPLKFELSGIDCESNNSSAEIYYNFQN